MLKITQIRSKIGYKPKARATLEAVGLRKIHQTVELPDIPSVRGMIQKIDYLLKVEESK
ncbi:MAG: 50S ribosomal protein L30 [Candidatus Neomarinimicrobiota bacterium]|nr:50S ribosomal protein L30 [Candidatus Neomarinimicrobiota bacterium]